MALDGTIAILETQLLPKEQLYKRWIGATHEEIAGHFDKGELRAYERHKGPINRILWCKPGHVYYQDRGDYSNPGLYDYGDDYCDYFLLEDVMRCETEHPEYIGDVTPESLGLVQAGGSDAKKNMTAFQDEEIQIDEIRKAMTMSPQDFVDFLNCRNADSNRLITSWEEGFRESGIYGPYFMRENLQNERLTVTGLTRTP